MKKDDDEDDAPTYVLEDTNQSLSKEEYEALVTGIDQDEKGDAAIKSKEQNKSVDQESLSKERIAEVGKANKKRKVVKVVGEGDEEGKEVSAVKTVPSTKKPRKKAKPVKLSFDDQEDG